MVQTRFVFYTKPRQLIQNSLELQIWSGRKITADSTKNKTIKRRNMAAKSIAPYIYFWSFLMTLFRYVEKYFIVKKMRKTANLSSLEDPNTGPQVQCTILLNTEIND